MRELPQLKETYDLSIELASPDQFIPELPGWRDRSPFIVREGRLDFDGQALSRLQRAHTRASTVDVDAMIARGLVEPAKLLRFYEAIEPELYRYPAINPSESCANCHRTDG